MSLRPAAVAAVLVLAACGSGDTTSDNSPAAPPTSVATTTTPDGQPTATSPTEGGLDDSAASEWVLNADRLCRQAIDQYQQQKSDTGVSEPEAVTLLAAQATSWLVEAMGRLPEPSSTEAEDLASALERFASGEHNLAVVLAGDNGYDQEMAAFDQLDAAGETLREAGQAAGSTDCSAVADDL